MYTRAIGPGKAKFVVEEGDPIVLTDLNGTIISGPHPAPANDKISIDYDGPRVTDACWGVLNPDGTLGFQSEPFTTLYGYERVNLGLDHPLDDHLLPEDRKWLKRVARIMP
jgi:hypothetical protein